MAEIERVRALNPMESLETRRKVSSILKAMKHEPSERGGNGHGLTVPQKILMDALGENWIAEYALSLGKKTPGYPTCYKVDLANPGLKVAIEVDGASHHSRKAQDEKKDQKLASLGWKVLRFWNKEILSWKDSDRKMETSISMILEQHGIHLSV